MSNDTSEQVFDIINPSDDYTIKGPFLHCAIAVAILGNGFFGIKGSPVLTGWEAWLVDQGIADLGEHIIEHSEEIATALDSVLIGDEREREFVELKLATMPEEEREPWLAKHHDENRGSMHDIGANAKKLAIRLRKNTLLQP